MSISFIYTRASEAEKRKYTDENAEENDSDSDVHFLKEVSDLTKERYDLTGDDEEQLITNPASEATTNPLNVVQEGDESAPIGFLDDDYITKTQSYGPFYIDNTFFVFTRDLSPIKFSEQEAVQKFSNNCERTNDSRLFKFVADIESYEITSKEISTLCPGIWLNDEVINGLLRLVKSKQPLNEYGARRNHVAEVLFNNKLMSKKYEYPARYFRTHNYNLFDCDRVFIPMNKNGSHWVFVYLDLTISNVISIYGFDPFGTMTFPKFELKRWIRDFINDKNHRKKPKKKWDSFDNITIRWINLTPEERQTDGFNCGVYTLYTMMSIIQNKPDIYLRNSQVNIARVRFAMDLINAGKNQRAEKESRETGAMISAMGRLKW